MGVVAVLTEFMIPQRPISAQVKRRKTLQAWKETVRRHADAAWAGKASITAGALQLTVVYLYVGPRADADNIIKPIQDALTGVIFRDDTMVTDVESHVRRVDTEFDTSGLSKLLAAHLATGTDGVYLRLAHSRPLEDYLR